ncbi:hypothetical protein [Dactylosporangium sp. NPDC048998]|uniref:hypothetical protein n=1 Tax=Dactylosporangium sp. NPDC048998 TaxID=3363976 RepID=UPI003711835C
MRGPGGGQAARRPTPDPPSCLGAVTSDADRIAPAAQLVLRAAVSAYLGRYRGQTRVHTESDLRVFFHWH